MNDILAAISNIGFPIVACYFMWKLVSDTLSDMKKTIDRNTEIVQKFIDRMDKEND